MLRFFKINGKDFVSCTEFHELLGLNEKNSLANIKNWLFETDYLFQGEFELLYPKENIHFYHHIIETTKGQKQEYYITKELSKLIAINSKSQIKKRYIQWLLSLEAKVETFDLLTLEQVLYLIDLIQCFKFITHQKAITKSYKKLFIGDTISKNSKITEELAAKIFNKLRNEALDIDKDDLQKRLKRYYDEENGRAGGKTMSNTDMIYLLDKFGLIKNAVYDYLKVSNKPTETAIKIGELAKKMAEHLNTEIRNDNTPDLFHPEIEQINISILDKIQPYLDDTKKIK